MAVFENEDSEPSTYKEAFLSKNKEKWIDAIKGEMSSLKENSTWSLTELPKDRKAIPCKWVYKVKKNPDGSIERFNVAECGLQERNSSMVVSNVEIKDI